MRAAGAPFMTVARRRGTVFAFRYDTNCRPMASDFLLQPLTQTSFALFKQKIAEPRKRKSLPGVNRVRGDARPSLVYVRNTSKSRLNPAGSDIQLRSPVATDQSGRV
jgi:hypothetical protein